ncbi:alanine--glyoxylate aminotransferase family protein [Oxyplasma meridianum]|uniref:Alanine--glyoxylate aminotransferase family protein n=1 Tax=Oxyplasma meridianum TaxID=3073602 RepID=A0AAX4NHB1_9ARCH
MVKTTLMHVGPSIGDYDVQLAGVCPDQGFASEKFKSAMSEALKGINYVMGCDDSYLPFIIPGSGTIAMESVTTFLQRKDKILVISNGVFGNRWEGIFSRYDVELTILKSHAGYCVSHEDIMGSLNRKHYKMIISTHVETSTGVKFPIEKYAKIFREHCDIIVVDGVASVGGELVKTSEWDIDIYITASQKAIGAPPGAGILVVKKKLFQDYSDENISGYFTNLMNWKPVMETSIEGNGGYFATPPIGVVFSLRNAFARIRDETMEKRVERHKKLSRSLRRGIKSMGLGIVAQEGYESSTVTGVLLKDMDADLFVKNALKFGVEFAVGVHPDLKGKYFRIGHMGWVSREDIFKALNAIYNTMKEHDPKTPMPDMDSFFE